MNTPLDSTAIQRALADASPAVLEDELAEVAYISIVRLIKEALCRGARTIVLGICGPQGSGKSTMSTTLMRVLSAAEALSSVTLSLDDLYLSREARAQLAKDIHPLLITRGVPGTHDVTLGIQVIEQLVHAKATTETRIPRFDKAVDDPCPTDRWDTYRGRPHVVILEGWCVGAIPQDATALAVPVNELERQEDTDGKWRNYVNDCLSGHYQDLFAMVDVLIMLNSPGFGRIAAWRQQQEDELARASTARPPGHGSRMMNEDEIRRFVAHFERITRHLLNEMPSRARLVVNLDGDRRVASVVESSLGCVAVSIATLIPVSNQ